MRPLAPVVALVGVAFASACIERRDIGELAAGQAPFSELRGLNIATLRVAEVRAFRRHAVPAPLEGLRETVGHFDLRYDVPGFDGSDGSWPREDVQVLDVEATREWPTDSAAHAAFRAAVRSIRTATDSLPRCLAVRGSGSDVTIAEFDRGGGWFLAVAVAPSTPLANGDTLSARHSLTVRRSSLSDRLPAAGAENPDERPTWIGGECPDD